MKNKLTLILTPTILAVGFSGCTWVKDSTQSSDIALVKPQAAAHCKQVGISESKSLYSLFWIPRSNKKVQQELISLAKKEAIVLKGDTIVAQGPAIRGKQQFDIYRCR